MIDETDTTDTTDTNGESKTMRARTSVSRTKRKSTMSSSNVTSRTTEPVSEEAAAAESVVSAADEQAPADEQVITDEQAPPPLESAAAAMREGASDARTAARKFWPTLSRATSLVAYSSCYYVSYGVVYSATVLCEVFPKNNPIVDGLADGARAARSARVVHKEALLEGAETTGLEIAAEAL
ncbi:MAG: hypothetical protein GKR94_11770 [Gammaproteobacteria bacterium]|nr:hypothetical protein [Gammaproteobacteria bacterium]